MTEAKSGWSNLEPATRRLAEELCTAKELTALRLWENGCGYRRIGNILGISMSTARGRVYRALDKISRAKEHNGHEADPL